MQRTRFPEFAQLPLDIQVTILDHVHDRRDPLEIPCYSFKFDKNSWLNSEGKNKIKRWAQLRLVCHQWSQWFSVSAVHRFAGKPRSLGRNNLLLGMPNLKYFFILWYDWISENGLIEVCCQRFACMIPSTIQHMDNFPVELLYVLSGKCSKSVQTIDLFCKAYDLEVVRRTEKMFQQFNGRIKHLFLYCPKAMIDHWHDILCGFDLEGLTLKFDTCWEEYSDEEMPALPATLHWFRGYGMGTMKLNWLPPNLEVLSLPYSELILSHDAQAMTNLKEIVTLDLRFTGQDIQSRASLLASRLPNVEKIVCAVCLMLDPGLFKELLNLRSLSLTAHYDEETPPVFNLADLPESLEELKFNDYTSGGVQGKPPLMPRLRKLDIRAQRLELPKDAFNNMPALEELILSADYNSVEFEDLLPLRDTLTELDLGFDCGNNVEVLSQFSRLKSLGLVVEEGKTLKLGRLSQSLEELKINGRFYELPNK